MGARRLGAAHAGYAAVFVLGLLHGTASESTAQSISSAQYSILTSFTWGSGTSNFGDVPMQVHDDWTGQYSGFFNGEWQPLTSYSAQARAETYGGTRPQAIATAEAHGSTIVLPVRFSALAAANIDYSARIRPRGTPPSGTYDVPITLHIQGHASGNAVSRVVISNFFNFSASTTGSEYREYDEYLGMSVPSDGSYAVSVSLQAQAEAFEFRNAYWAHSSQALADPVFAFDQAAFDLQMGAETFPLADYFEFEYSPGIITPAPGVASLGLSLALLAGVRRRW